MRRISTIIGLIALVAWGSPAFANVYGNPVPALKKGQMSAGLALEQFERDYKGYASGDMDFDRETLLFSYGVSDSGVARVAFGTFEITTPDKYDGNEYGISYRHRFGEPGKDLKKAFFFSYRTATGDGTSGGIKVDMDLTQMDIGAGVSKVTGETLSIFGGLVYSKFDAELTTGFVSGDFDADKNIGIFGGFEMKFEENMFLALEIHAMFESGIGLMFQYVL